VNGWVTNLLCGKGDYTATGQTAMSLDDSDSFWVDGYFEETALKLIHEGQSAIRVIGLMGGSEDLALSMGAEPTHETLKIPKMLVHMAAVSQDV
jgi:hypothetical protein